MADESPPEPPAPDLAPASRPASAPRRAPGSFVLSAVVAGVVLGALLHARRAPVGPADPPTPVSVQTDRTLEPTPALQPVELPAPPPVEPAPAPAAAPEPAPEPVAPDPPAAVPELPTPVVAPSGDPRDPPAGTAADVARSFSRLPKSPADRPPVGAIGRSGIHVDRIAMGARYARGQCQGPAGPFSIGKDGRANVCFRVVHPRQDEELVVLWQKDGQTQRRAKVGVPASQHGYRTRAHMLLRAENAGTWTVRILSSDGAELAGQAFAVVP